MSTALIPVDSDSAALEADPDQYMAVVLNRAQSWLAEAKSIDDVRQAKALAVGMESVVREKELAFDAQLSATELVRRCERRIGELVREGQRDGTVLRRGQRVDRGSTPDLRVHEAVGVGPNNTDAIDDHYALADASAKHFEQAITIARLERNLSRANVVRRIKGEAPKRRRRVARKPDLPADYLPDLLPGSSDDHELRTAVVKWCDSAGHLRGLLDSGARLTGRFNGDKEALIRGLELAEQTAKTLKGEIDGD